MGQPKKQSSMRKTGTRRSHLLLKLARRVNGTSPVKIRTTKRESGKKAPKSDIAIAALAARNEPKTTKKEAKAAKKAVAAK
ncbi:MAG TPA: hypothetical protein VK502_03875 [Candidatus Saccharimonadales bacterium]|nr:hypothetical protein [Candidatus Saccharimonadales bacterium]